MKSTAFSLLMLVSVACGPTIGDACTKSDECNGSVCVMRDFTPGGMCSAACDFNSKLPACPTGSTCVKDALGSDVAGCMRLCGSSNACRAGYVCRSANGSANVCIGPQGI